MAGIVAPCCKLQHTCRGHSAAVMAVAFSENGRYVMSASQDKSVRLWNPHTGVSVKTYCGTHNHEINDVKILRDNSKFLTCGGDKQFFVTDVTTSQVVRKFVGHDRKINALALTSNEDVIVSASHDKTVRIWDMRARSKGSMQVLADATDSVLCACVSGDKLLTGCVDGAVRHYDIRQGQLTVDELLSPVGSVSVSNDGQCVLASTLDHKIRLLEGESGSELALYEGHSNQRFKTQSTLDPTDAFVISGSEDHRICFWELVEGNMLCSVKHSAPVFCVELFSQTMVTAAADGIVQVWQVSPY